MKDETVNCQPGQTQTQDRQEREKREIRKVEDER